MTAATLKREDKQKQWKKRALLALFLGPALILSLSIIVYPIINTVIRSFTDPQTGAFSLMHYAYLFTNRIAVADIWYTLWITVVTVVLSVFIAYLLALYLRFSNSRIAKFIGTMYLLPRFIPGLVAVYAMKVVISDSGLINRLSLLLPETAALFNLKPGLLYNPRGIILMNLWFNIPFATMIIVAALSGISDSIIESARDVGAGRARIFIRMIVPLSIRDVMIAMTFIFMSNISSFTTPYLIGENFPQMLGVFLRKQFSNRAYERAAAISVLIFLFSSVSAIVYIYTNLKEKEWEKG
ncbi:MAG: ABC transporter permease [Clostridiales bacterium]|nr:ABC transporter permease [Clostridiales bacterium]